MADDLAREHAPLTALFPRLNGAESAQAYRLNPDQLAFYEEHGYVAGVEVLDGPQIDALLSELAELTNPSHGGNSLFHEFHSNESADPNTVLFHALGAWRIAPAFHDILWNPAFTVPASQLLGGPVRFWHDQLFCKPAGHGGVVAWHQDYSYWTRTQPMAHLTCWIALDEARGDNGCLQYVPGSHRWDLLPITGLAGDMNAIRQVLSDDQWERLHNPVSIELPAGRATFHHPLMIHGSRENFTNRPRRATVINVVRDGVTSATAEPLLAGVPPIPADEPLGGKFFPMLYSP